jgi:putative salt-induced outer membrane protein YdiY
MKNKRLIPLTVVMLCALHAAPAAADVVTLADGSRLVGTIERMADGKLILVTEYAGTLEIDASKIVTIETDQPVNVGTTTGDRLVGKIEWSPDEEKAVVHSEVGTIPVPTDKIEAIWPKDGKSPEALALEEQVAKAKEEAEAAQARWSATFEAGVFYTDGNSEILRASGRAEVRRTTLKDLMKFYVSGEYSEEDKRRSSHEVKGGAYYEYLFTERWYGYGRMELEYDEFEDLDLRFTTAVGAGYYWLKKPEHELKTFAGIGFLHESFRDGTDRNAAQAEVGLDYRLDITPWMRFTNSTVWYPTFESLRDYRLVSDSAFLFPLGDSDVWKLKLGALYEYDPIPQPGFERLDQTYYANIVLEMK